MNSCDEGAAEEEEPNHEEEEDPYYDENGVMMCMTDESLQSLDCFTNCDSVDNKSAKKNIHNSVLLEPTTETNGHNSVQFERFTIFRKIVQA